jgi:tRNA 2-thiouridine synthesizing protein A
VTVPADDEPDLVLDCLGRPCPVPVVELARALQRLPPGSLVEVLADDPAALVDVPAFCRMRGHAYLGARSRPMGSALLVRSAD